MAIGLLTSGYVITKYKPPPKYLFFWNVVIGIISMCAAISYTQLGCESNNSLLLNGTIVSCNSNCVCDGISYSPVCDRSTGTTYFSPCHAGCRTYNETEKVYKDCSCDIETSISTKRSTAQFLAAEISMESFTNQAISNGEEKPTEKRITLEDIYDEELKPNKPPHDDDVAIDENHLYDESDDYEDNSETEEIVNTGNIETTNIDTGHRERRQMTIERVVSPGACNSDCTFDYYTFSLISMFSSLISSTGRIGNVLLNFRYANDFLDLFSISFTIFHKKWLHCFFNKITLDVSITKKYIKIIEQNFKLNFQCG